MVHVHVGMDWYGAVKHVGAYRVVTAFFHVSSFPVYPRYSAVIGKTGPNPEWKVLPLARIDWQSVVIAYFRGIAGGLVVLGSIALIFGFMFWLLNDQQSDPPPSVIMSGGGIVIAIGAVLGAASYLFWRRPCSRERIIREIANTHLSAAVDPAGHERALAHEWADALNNLLSASGLSDYRRALERAHEYSQQVRELLLLRVRCELAVSDHDPLHEGRTDLLLRNSQVQR